MEGATQREHLMAVWERTGVMPKTLADAPRCPPACAHLWPLFGELRASVQGGFGVGRISYSEMLAHRELTGVVLEPWEIDALRRVDHAFVVARAKK